jgi:acyl-CoA thioesterase FadM
VGVTVDGYRFVTHVVTTDAHFDEQAHLNNTAIVGLFNDLRIAYVQQCIGPRWIDHLRAERLVVAARELHVLYESEGRPGESFVGATRYARREGKAAVVEQRLLEAVTARPVASAWVVQLLARDGRVVDWPGWYWDLVAAVEGGPVPLVPSRPRPAWGPGCE